MKLNKAYCIVYIICIILCTIYEHSICMYTDTHSHTVYEEEIFGNIYYDIINVINNLNLKILYIQ